MGCQNTPSATPLSTTNPDQQQPASVTSQSDAAKQTDIQTYEGLRTDLQRLQAQVTTLGTDLSRSQADQVGLRSEVGGLQGQVNAKNAEISKLQAWAQQLEAESKKKDAAVQQLQGELQKANAALAAYRAREAAKKKVIFINGLDSTSATANFGELQVMLGARGYGFQDFLQYSYAGGELNGLGDYSPAPYGCEATRSAAMVSAQPLDNLLRAYREVRPDVQITLVGYSMGGLVALRAGWNDPVSVVTIGAPLQGINSSVKLLVAALSGCPKGSDAALIDLRNQSWAPVNGQRILNVANRNDCVYNPKACPVVLTGLLASGLGCVVLLSPESCVAAATGLWQARNESESQVIPGAEHYWPQVPALDNIEASHHAVLSYRPALDRIAAFIGPQIR